MPLVRMFLRSGTSPEYRKALGDGVHNALVEALAIPPDDRFQVISEHRATDLILTTLNTWEWRRSERVVFVQIILSAGRKPQQKRKLFKTYGGNSR